MLNQVMLSAVSIFRYFISSWNILKILVTLFSYASPRKTEGTPCSDQQTQWSSNALINRGSFQDLYKQKNATDSE